MLLTPNSLTDIQELIISETQLKLTEFQRTDFRFEEGPHKYYLGETELTSVTTYLHHFSRPFDGDYWSRKKADERCVEQAVILKEWSDIADRACFLGTEVHKWIEDFFNGLQTAIHELDIEAQDRIHEFIKLYEKRLHKLIPIGQEIRMFNRKMKLAGTLDALFMAENGDIYILDWKTNKKIVTDKDRSFGNMQFEFANQKDNNMNHYSIQTSIYRLMLKDAGIEAKGCFIVYIPPVGECQVLPCKDYRMQLIEHFNLNSADYGL